MSADIKDGGHGEQVERGLPADFTPRDYFAAAALQGILAAYAGEDVSLPAYDMAAYKAYDYADAMLKVREQS